MRHLVHVQHGASTSEFSLNSLLGHLLLALLLCNRARDGTLSLLKNHLNMARRLLVGANTTVSTVSATALTRSLINLRKRKRAR